MATILIVDDEALVCETLQAVMTQNGYHALTAADGVEAIEIVRKKHVDLVIADIVMPEKDGLEVILELKSIRPDLNVIAISGGSRIGSFDFLGAADRLGACRSFYKPLDNDVLLSTVEDCLKSEG